MKIISVIPDVEAVFISRENRFLGKVKIGDEEVRVHIHDPGRLQELLYEGNKVLLKKAHGKNRKTSWDLIAAKYENMWVFVNSSYHRKIAEIILKNSLREYSLRAEVKIGRSRIDFIAEGKEKIAIEVKGCTLARDSIALFPDAPTERGARHLQELMEFIEQGNHAMLLILVFREDSRCFLPNTQTDEKFSSLFWKAVKMGVKVRPMLLKYDGRDISYLRDLPVCTL